MPLPTAAEDLIRLLSIIRMNLMQYATKMINAKFAHSLDRHWDIEELAIGDNANNFPA